MDRKYKVGGYVKLAKLWERSKDVAVAYHSSYYAERFRDDAEKRLVGVYIDITGNKEIYKRPEMVHLLQDCKKGIVNLIFSQTRAYLAANTCDFCFLLKYLFDIPMRVDVVTDDDDQRIDTILDVDNQRQTAYNSYTDVLYVFPDSICENLLSVIRNRYIMTTESISYENARTLEQAFSAEYLQRAVYMGGCLRHRQPR